MDQITQLFENPKIIGLVSCFIGNFLIVGSASIFNKWGIETSLSNHGKDYRKNKLEKESVAILERLDDDDNRRKLDKLYGHWMLLATSLFFLAAFLKDKVFDYDSQGIRNLILISLLSTFVGYLLICRFSAEVSIIKKWYFVSAVNYLGRFSILLILYMVYLYS